MLGILLICYLFVGGVGAGTCLIVSLMSACISYRRRRDSIEGGSENDEVRFIDTPYRDLIARGYTAAVLLLVLAAIFLVADLGRLDRVALLFSSPTLSFIAIGAFALATCLIVALYQWLVWNGFINTRASLFMCAALLLVVSSLVIMTYTGLLLQDISAIPLWSNAMIPPLFLVSSLSGGIAVVAILFHFSEAFSRYHRSIRYLIKIDVVVKIVEVVVCGAFVGIGYSTGSDAFNPTDQTVVVAMDALLWGQDAGLLFGGFICLGLILPLIFDIVMLVVTRPLPLLTVISAGCVLFGGFVVRYCIVQAGVNVASSLLGFGA